MLNNNIRNMIRKKLLDNNEIDNNEIDNNEIDNNDLSDYFVDDTVLKNENYIKFNMLDKLTQGLPPKSSNEIDICCYHIINNAKPFILYCLYKNDDNVLVFPSIAGINETLNVVEQSQSNLEYVFSNFAPIITYKGYSVHNNKYMLWFNYKLNDTDTLTFSDYNNRWWWCLVSEIINYKKSLTFPIDIKIINLLLNNNELFYLRDEKNNIYQVPQVGYYGGYYNEIHCVAVLGVSRQSTRASLGPYYYFGNYKSAARYAVFSSSRKPVKLKDEFITVDENGRWKKGGMVRFAIFPEIQTMRIKDKNDTLKNNTPDINMQTGGVEWIDKYDSVGLGLKNIKTSDGRNALLQPQIVIKNYEQQVPLTYYYINTNQDINNDVLID